MKKQSNSLTDLLYTSLEDNKETEIPIRYLIERLGNKGQALLVMLLSLPFCLPIQIPGLSSPFGLILILLGFRMSLRKIVWLPGFLIEKKYQDLHYKKLLI